MTLLGPGQSINVQNVIHSLNQEDAGHRTCTGVTRIECALIGLVVGWTLHAA